MITSLYLTFDRYGSAHLSLDLPHQSRTIDLLDMRSEQDKAMYLDHLVYDVFKKPFEIPDIIAPFCKKGFTPREAILHNELVYGLSENYLTQFLLNHVSDPTEREEIFFKVFYLHGKREHHAGQIIPTSLVRKLMRFHHDIRSAFALLDAAQEVVDVLLDHIPGENGGFNYRLDRKAQELAALHMSDYCHDYTLTQYLLASDDSPQAMPIFLTAAQNLLNAVLALS